ncbi:MAG TPA: polysaccharide export protein EpsE [Methylibium sp.]|uniref:polysaccharide export protein EpsE n=1 Tax=Methylibium sp. TaxID=2067992 RepID=UPI002DBCA1DF|nr:polysaccharide export protein EpsE [Methylibium sp.]HEU4459287.1 polysaccharide export protein EpsE [Methylibium sp.]
MRSIQTLKRVLAGLAMVLMSGLVVGQAPPPAATAAPPEYKLAAGDSVRITVFQNPDLSIETRIAESGSISFPLLGAVKLAGLTTAQGEKLIADGLKSGNFVKAPQVSIVVATVRGNQVSVLGQVLRPGRYPIETAEMRLTDLLALAGGISPTGADVVTVVGKRNNKPFRFEVDLPTVFGPDRTTNDVLLQNEDVVWVDRAPMFFVYGEVQRPGALRLERGLTLMRALATAGGLTQRGTEKGIRVHRRGPDGKVQILTPGLEEVLRADDVVYVRESLF